MKNTIIFVLLFLIISSLFITLFNSGLIYLISPSNQVNIEEFDKTNVIDGFDDQIADKILASFESNPNLTKLPLGEDVLSKKKVSNDFDGDGEIDVLSISISYDFQEDVNTNMPIKIKLKIANSEIVYVDEWNDNVYLHITDFNKEDKFKDIYVLHTGTDVSYASTIYRYDGNSIYKYADFAHLRTTLYYDEKGSVYFVGLGWPNGYDDGESIPYGFESICFDYVTGEMKIFNSYN